MSEFRTINKRSMLFWTILVMIFVLSFISAINDYSNTYLARMDMLAETDPDKALEETLAMLQLVFSIMALLLCCFGIYLVSCGRRSIQSQSFPPPHSWIIEGRRIITGRAAQRVGRFQAAAGSLLVVVALLMLLFVWFMFPELAGTGQA